MKYTILNTEAVTITIAPSLTSAIAIKRIKSGIFKEETLLQRLNDIYKVSALQQVLSIIDQVKKILLKAKEGNEKLKLTASSDVLNIGKYRLDINYKKREKEVIKILSSCEIFQLAKAFNILSMGGKLGSEFNDHPLKDYSLNTNTNVVYHQNLKGFRSFSIRRDAGFKKRQKQDPYAESKAIICLYKPVIEVCDLFTLYNIGLHDQVYNTSVEEYEIIDSKQSESKDN